MHQIDGVTRTVTASIIMTIDFEFKNSFIKGKHNLVQRKCKSYIFEFSDDDAPESDEQTMIIGTL